MTTETIVYDIGDIVLCDLCNADFTNSEAIGGFIFGSKGVCPTCAPRFEADAKSYDELHYIRARCADDQSFADFVREYRGLEGSKVTITTFGKE
jgi:hypothetical protein